MGIEQLLTDNPEAIAFGRSRLAALRALGKTHVTQVFDTPWGQVKVRIVGAAEYIECEPPGLYLTQPLSRLHQDGLTVIDGAAASTWAEFTLQTGGKPKVKEDSKLVAMAVDWVSANGRDVITYDHGFQMRHKWRNDTMDTNTPLQGVCRDGKYLMTERPVSGAALRKGRLVYASFEWDATHALPNAVVIYDREWKEGATETEIGRFPINSATAVEWVDDAVFFGGSGSSFVCKIKDVPAGRYRALRGVITGDRVGDLATDFTWQDMGPVAAPGSESHVFLDMGRDDALLVGRFTGIVANSNFIFVGLGVESVLTLDGEEVETWPATDPDGPTKRIYLRALDLRRKAVAFIEVRSAFVAGAPFEERGHHVIVLRARVNGGDWLEKQAADARDQVPDILPDWLVWLIDSPTGYPTCFVSRRPGEFVLCLMPWVSLPVFTDSVNPTQLELRELLGFYAGTVDPLPLIVMAKSGINRGPFDKFKLGEEPGFQILPLAIVK